MNRIKQYIHSIIITFLAVFICTTSKCFGQYLIKYCGSFGHPIILSISDSINIKQTDEKVLIDLYKDFAVIKGQFVFFNASNRPISLRMGYRSNGPTSGFLNYNSNEYSIFSDAKSLKIVKFIINRNEYNLKQVEYSENLKFNWNKWECDWYGDGNRFNEVEFEIKSFSYDTISICAVVDIDNAQIHKSLDYRKIHCNTFVYNLGCSTFLNKSIEKFKLTIQLKEGIQIDDIYALFPKNKLKTTFYNNVLIFEGNNIDNTYSDIIIAHNYKPFWLFDYSDIFGYSEHRKRKLAIQLEANSDIKNTNFVPKLKEISELKFKRKPERKDDFEGGQLLILGSVFYLLVVKYLLLIVIVSVIALIIVFSIKKTIKMIKKRKLP